MNRIFSICILLLTLTYGCSERVKYVEPGAKAVDLGLLYDKVWHFENITQEAFYTPFEQSIPIDNKFFPFPDRSVIFNIGIRFVQESKKFEVTYKNDFAFEVGFWESKSDDQIEVTFVRNFKNKDFTGSKMVAFRDITNQFINKFFLPATPYVFKIARTEFEKTNFTVRVEELNKLPVNLQNIISESSTNEQFNYYQYTMFWNLKPNF